MTISAIRTTRLHHRLNQPYVWAQGVKEHISTILIEVEDDSGCIGIGEGVCVPDPEAVERIVRRLSSSFIGRDPFPIEALCATAYHSFFEAWGASLPRFGNQVLAGLEMALWDLAGKITGRPVHDLLGGRAIPASGTSTSCRERARTSSPRMRRARWSRMPPWST